MGNAKQIDPTKTKHGFHKRIIANPLYVSPEYKTQGFYGPYSDIYGLGLVLFHACTCNKYAVNLNAHMQEAWGKHPSKIEKIVKDHPIPSHFSEEIRSIVQAMVSRNFNNRPSAKALLAKKWLTKKEVAIQRKRIKSTFQKLSTEKKEGLHALYVKANDGNIEMKIK